jgi:AsmA protein
MRPNLDFLKKINWKYVGIGVGALFGVLVLAVGLFIAFFPADLAAREAERRIEEATARDLVLAGDVQVSFWPALGFSVTQASLSNPQGFSQEQPFIAADRIVFAVKVMPLLRGAIEVKELIFENADVSLIAEADGTANWTFPTEEDENQTTIDDLRLEEMRFTDGTVTFDGAGEGAPLVLEDVDASFALDSLDQPVDLDLAFNFRDQRVTVEGQVGLPRAVLEKGQTPLSATVASDALDVSFDGAFDSATGALDGALDARGASVRRLLAWIGSPMADGGGFARFSVVGQMARREQTITLSNARLRLDEIEASGDLSIITQENDRLRIDGALSAPRIDLNTYLPAPAQGANAGGVEVSQSWSNEPIDFSGLRALDANLALSVDALRFQQMEFAGVAMALRIANGAADARLTRMSLYEGAATGRLIADGSGATPRIAVELNAENIQAEPLLQAAIGFDKIAGRGRLTASLVGTGASQAAIMRSLSGNASFNFNDGIWKGVNLAQMARVVQSLSTGQTAGQGGGTDFAEMSATFAIADGVAATDNVRLLNPFVRLEGQGLINIGGQTIDMRLAPRAVRSAEGQGGDAGLAGLGIPFRVSGPWANVSFRPAVEEIVQNQLRDILSNQEQGSPLSQLGELLFGRAPPPAPVTEPPADGETPAETPAAEGEASETPAPAETEQPRNPFGDILRRAIEGGRDKEKAPEAPASESAE